MTSEQIQEGSAELSMIVLIDTLAERYGMLPSQIVREANTFDMFIADTAIGYRNYLVDKAEGRATMFRPESYSTDELMTILKQSRGQS